MNSNGFGDHLIYERCWVIIWDFRIQSYAFVDSGFLFSLFGFGDDWLSRLVVIHPESNFKVTLGLDSLDFVDLVVAVESNFGVKLVGEDFINVTTLQHFYNLIEKKVA